MMSEDAGENEENGDRDRMVIDVGSPRMIAVHHIESDRYPGLGVAYNTMERREYENRLDSLATFDVLVICWLRAISLLDDGVSANPPKPRAPEREQARVTQMLLYALALGTAKAGLDATLAGYYPGAFASVRLLLESVIAIRYIHAFPERSRFWWDGKRDPRSGRMMSPKVSQMRADIIDQRGIRTDERFLMVETNIENLYNSWSDMSIGDHASPELVRGMLQPDGSVETYPTIVEAFALLVFRGALVALANVLGALALVHQVGRDDPLVDLFPDRPGLMENLYQTLEEIQFHLLQLNDAADQFVAQDDGTSDPVD